MLPLLFKITGISTTGFTSSTIPSTSTTSNEINGTVGLASNSSGIITITGEYTKGFKANSFFNLVSNVSSPASDNDLTNNTATTKIDVRKCNVPTNPSMPSRY